MLVAEGRRHLRCRSHMCRDPDRLRARADWVAWRVLQDAAAGDLSAGYPPKLQRARYLFVLRRIAAFTDLPPTFTLATERP